MPARPQIILALLLACAPLHAATRYVQEPQLEGCNQWQEIEQAVMDGKIDRKEAQRRFKEQWPQVSIDDIRSEKERKWQWVFPVPGSGEDDWSSQSYSPGKYKFYDSPNFQGHPGVNIYIRDANRDGLEDRTQKPAAVVSCTDGVVVSARKFWAETDPNPLGVYVVVLSQEEKRFFYYCNLSKLKVGLGQLVSKGEILGWVGRTGSDTAKKHLGTHLRFHVHSFDDGLFYPVFPGRALKEAYRMPFPLKGPEYRKLPKHLYEIPVTPTPGPEPSPAKKP